MGSFAKVTVAAAAAVALLLAPLAAAQSPTPDPSVYVGTPTNACPTVGVTLRNCRCSAVITPPRSTVLPTDEVSGLWCPVVPGPAITRYYCDEAGTIDCGVVCRPPRGYCAGPSRVDGKCRCGTSGNRIVVVRK